MIDHYDWPGGREAVLRFGPATGPVVLILPALFEEHNRTRRFTVEICRALAGLGIASLLPDLPGQNESPLPTDQATLDDWRAAVVAVAGLATGRLHVASIRGGAILDEVPGAASVWRLSPIPGQAVLRDLQRAALVGGKPASGDYDADDFPRTFAGNSIGWPLFSALRADAALATLEAPLRTVRLEGDVATADVRLPGAPLWRRSEPGDDPTLAQMLAADIAVWLARCGN